MNMDAWERMMAKIEDARASVLVCRQALQEAERRAEQIRAAVERALEGTEQVDQIEHFTLAENLERAALASQLQEHEEVGHVEAVELSTMSHGVRPDEPTTPIKLRPWKTWAANVRQAGGPDLMCVGIDPDWWTDHWKAGMKPREAVRVWQQANTAKALANATAEAARLVESAGPALAAAQEYVDANCLVDRPDGCRRRPVLADPAAQAEADRAAMRVSQEA